MIRLRLAGPLSLCLATSALLAQGPESWVVRPANTGAAPAVTTADSETQLVRLDAPAPIDGVRERSVVEAKPQGRLQHVMFDRPQADGPLWAIGQSWKASFDSQGFTFIPFFGSQAPQNFPLRLELAGASVGGQALELGAAEPVRAENAVRTARGAVTEVIDLRLREVEQSFVFETLPNRGAIRVDVAIQTDLNVTAIAGGLRFANEHGNVDYTTAVAVDAAGARLDLDIMWTGTAAQIEIPAAFVAAARLPLVLDPVVFSSALPSWSTYAVSDPDVAVLQGPGRRLVIWRQQFSAADHDLIGHLLDTNLAVVNPFGQHLIFDITGLDYLASTVASNEFAQNFMAASEIRQGTLYWIGGRTVSAFGVLGSTFDIEKQFVIGGFGNNVTPDIGGDPYPGPGAYCVVFEKQVGLARDIYFKMVRPDGTLPNPNPTALDLSATPESRPTISKSNGMNQWMIVWERSDFLGPFNFNIVGAIVDWQGIVAVPAFFVSTLTNEETRPVVSSPAVLEGATYYMVAHEINLISQNKIGLRMVSSLGAVNTTAGILGNPATNQAIPDIDSDGIRFAVAYTDDQGARAATMAFHPSTSQWLVQDGAALSVLPNFESFTRICAHRSGGGFPSPRYVIADLNAATNQIGVYEYGGYVAGPLFTVVPTQCGNLSITPSGTPAVGSNVTFTVGGPASFTLFGFPGSIPLNALGCNCVAGVNNALIYGNPFTWTVPASTQFVGTVLAVQGLSITGSQCLSAIDLSDTVQFAIR